ncbi:hypothetical protein Q8G42_03905 [Acinetobacter lwoffii]|jgi:hypothetical protein|uniref:Uncharacterized protein n=1 Tax=Acinetobacter lwoffii TaxID=28090 RepID=A0AAW8ANQ4_ACILW|nr:MULTISPECIES: hypothetical protein [Acinetobacter]ENU63026.1 hypothetical protein F980_01114 [Acinetobacter lwoffii NIPH 715]ENX29282.1 hypothetical protein F890_02390 [Acinetobacter sp. CIP 64.7]SPJ21970.1 hypothetical protein PFCIP103579_3114 [Prolinoborus fasciculus]MCU4616636.1 hypothetical protein [Acinetobacter lwoffii]MDP1369942.1 hypothetical protein [Acinetobacter lwoffii]
MEFQALKKPDQINEQAYIFDFVLFHFFQTIPTHFLVITINFSHTMQAK